MIFLRHKYLIVTFICFLFGTGLFFSLLFISTPFNPIQHELPFLKNIFDITPQGWAFFTRDAREEQIYIYRIDDQNSLHKINQKHSDATNLFGLSRESSKLAIETENILYEFQNKDVFLSTDWNYDAMIIGEIPENYINVKNKINSPILCGNYLFVYHRIVPWAWSKSKKTIKMPARVIKLKIEC